jgi:hypothetical protein
VQEAQLLREASRPTVWFVLEGVRYGVPNIDAFRALGVPWERVTMVPDDSLDDIPMCPTDGTVVQEANGDSYVTYRGMRFTLANEDFGPRGDFWTSQIAVVVPEGFLGLIPEGGPYRPRLRGRFGGFFIWLRRQERSQRSRIIASGAFGFVIGVGAGIAATALWTAFAD